MKTNETFACPVCGEAVRKGAPACPACGADERTGWSDRTYLDGIDFGDDTGYDELLENEFPSARKRRDISWIAVVAAVLLLLSLAGLLKIFL